MAVFYYEDKEMDYSEYIQSPEWKEKSLYIKELRGYKCQVCGISGNIETLNTHHNSYARVGNELDSDLVVLCANCHELFHKNGRISPSRKIVLADSKVFSILWDAGITYTNDDPWKNYSLGKSIIWNLVESNDWELFDRYNKINIGIVDEACLNQQRKEYKQAMKSGDWSGYESEECYRAEARYWENRDGKL